MQLIRDNPGRQMLQSSVVTIGNFDGLHLGHQALIERCRLLAKNAQPLAMVTFEPLPGAWFRPDATPARLMSVRQKLEFLDDAGIDLVWIMRFNQALAGMDAEQFVQSVLVDVLDASRVVVGEDFRYGRARQGDTDLLRQAGDKHGFSVNTVDVVKVDGERASSSGIRKYLASGDLLMASRLLGRPFRMQGRVIQGKQLGRALGYPTANMALAVSPSPLKGVFAVKTKWGKGDWCNAVANLGTRPAVGGEGFLVEVHLFDFDGDLYGQRLEVEFIKKLRDEEHFEDIDDLVMQMREDERLARECLEI